MTGILLTHLYLAYLIVAVAVLFVWWPVGRRVMLYLLTLQIVLGIVVIVMNVRAPWYHPALGVVAWIGYMAANGVGRRRGETVARIIAGISSVAVLGGYAVGEHVARAAGLPHH